MGKGEIWIYPASNESGRHIKKVFDEANFLNQVRLIDDSYPLEQCLNDGANPLAILMDLGCAGDTAWDFVRKVRGTKTGSIVPLIALVDDNTERLLDKAYDAGVQSYLRKPLTFTDFLQRARLLNMEFSIQRSGLDQHR